MAKADDYPHVRNNLDTVEKSTDDPGSPQLPPILRKMDDEPDEPVIPKLLGLYLIVQCSNEIEFNIYELFRKIICSWQWNYVICFF